MARGDDDIGLVPQRCDVVAKGCEIVRVGPGHDLGGTPGRFIGGPGFLCIGT